MPRSSPHLLPILSRILKEVGVNLKLARLRRKLSTAIIAERAQITRTTLRKIENGEGSVSMGAYASVLHCLGLHGDLAKVGAYDLLGQKLQDAGLTEYRKRAPKIKKIED